MEKTNAMRQLDRLKVPYTVHEYGGGALSGTEVAATIGQPPERVFKTLVTTGKSGNHYVFMVPVAEELDLKKAAVAVGEKSVAMLPQKELLPLTGYVHGGCSPIGMKKGFTTVVHVTAEQAETIYFSAGKIGLQIETAPSSLCKAVRLTFSDICKENEK